MDPLQRFSKVVRDLLKQIPALIPVKEVYTALLTNDPPRRHYNADQLSFAHNIMGSDQGFIQGMTPRISGAISP